MSGSSGSIKNGQTINLRSGASAIKQGDLVQIGGPGNEAYPVVTSDFAAKSAVSALTPASVVGAAVNNYARWGSATDSLGNIYVISPRATSQGVSVTKYTPAGAVAIALTTLDPATNQMICMRVQALATAGVPNGNFVAVYADSVGTNIKFVIFDSNLNIVAGPTVVGAGYVLGGIIYADFCTLATGGFAVVYENSAHTQIILQTYSATGSAVLAATNVQSVTGTGLFYLKVAQLGNSNLVVALRGAGTPAGTSFVIVTTGGTSVVTNTVMDSVATAGFVELSVLSAGTFFALADMNGTITKAAVYSQAGALQGGAYSGASTLNNVTYNQIKLAQDGNNFYLFYILTAGGLKVVQLTQAGASTSVSPNAIDTTTFSTTSSLDATVSNNMAFVLGCSTSTGGQGYVTIGLPDVALGANFPYLVNPVVALGTAAGTTGSYWPGCRSTGDFTAVVVYDQQTSVGLFFSIVKWANSAIQGVSQTAVAVGSPGTSIVVNPGPGSYPVNPLNGTSGLVFDHSQATIAGNKGEIFYAGASLSDPVTAAVYAPLSTGFIGALTYASPTSGSITYTAVTPVQIYVTLKTTAGGSTLQINGGADITASVAPPSGSSSYSPIFLAAGQTILLTASAITGTVTMFAQKVN
ncbi:MAG: hypothetical protein V4447_10600 [Pseudomonadota bacterium]